MFESGWTKIRTRRPQDLPTYSPVTYPLGYRAFDNNTKSFQLYICNIEMKKRLERERVI